MSTNEAGNNPKLKRVETTTDTLTSRAGLSALVRFKDSINLSPLVDRKFGSIRKHEKGISVVDAFHQALCFFWDGTDFALKQFDRLKEQTGYARTIEQNPDNMATSHQMKRFFKGFNFRNNHQFRHLLQELFVWQINHHHPDVIRLDLDTVVLNNDDAQQREGVEPTHEHVKGFKPLLLKWNGRVVDFVFRGGAKHCNNGETVMKMIHHVTERIREEYDRDVPIVLTADNAFMGQENFREFEQLGIGYIVGGKKHDDLIEEVRKKEESSWERIKQACLPESGKEGTYRVTELRDKRDSWETSRRALYCQLLKEDEQRTLGLRETVYYTNIGVDKPITDQLLAAGNVSWLTKRKLVQLAHGRGESELVHRKLKEFGPEKLPLKSFQANHAYYGTMLVAYSLYCSFKEQVTDEVISEEVMSTDCYPSTFRRRFLDVAGKVVSHSRELFMKVTEDVMSRLGMKEVFERANSPPAPALC